MSRIGEFQPEDPPEEDRDTLWERWFDQQEKNGYVVISRDEWHSKLDAAATDGYAEGRKDEREESLSRVTELLAAYFGEEGQPAIDAARAAIAKATGGAA